MNENINLCELLKGHEGETFYSPLCGNTTFIAVCNDAPYPITTNDFNLRPDGKRYSNGEIMLFPSKDQRDWNKWVEEQKPKTWDKFCKNSEEYSDLGCRISMTINGDGITIDSSVTGNGTTIEKSVLALLKIHQLIEVGYGGNITDEEWKNINIPKYIIICNANTITHDITYTYRHHIAFYTKQQRDEFLSYPENVQLLKDYYMIC